MNEMPTGIARGEAEGKLFNLEREAEQCHALCIRACLRPTCSPNSAPTNMALTTSAEKWNLRCAKQTHIHLKP